MILHLDNKPFESIKNGTKTIEMRLFDEKRRLLKENDIIEFINRTTNESIKAKIIKLHIFKNFEELYNHFDKVKLGYSKDEVADFKDMTTYYSIMEQEKYGVVGIEIELI